MQLRTAFGDMVFQKVGSTTFEKNAEYIKPKVASPKQGHHFFKRDDNRESSQTNSPGFRPQHFTVTSRFLSQRRSDSNPEDVRGVAHLCEHVVCLSSTEKYLDEGGVYNPALHIGASTSAATGPGCTVSR
ncbi:hypothetical protein L596_017124 [Steinernema carpocapsae]|uniref:Peptidase M16 N-terminal domain-containing protein n=1 Tax=Steinernema carpocapsae TaxID=34508 RepID=A0A4U5N0L5_STECR|nr:hypothetical protein L596_017124 [Steinernema carpocapsae]